jgi:hypothetical protein
MAKRRKTKTEKAFEKFADTSLKGTTKSIAHGGSVAAAGLGCFPIMGIVSVPAGVATMLGGTVGSVAEGIYEGGKELIYGEDD